MSHAENKVTQPDGDLPALCSGGLVRPARRSLQKAIHAHFCRPGKHQPGPYTGSGWTNCRKCGALIKN